MDTSPFAPMRLFGLPRWQALDGTCIAFNAQRRFQLLTLLACQGDWMPRTALAEMLWPERPDSTALGNLRKVLMQVQRMGLRPPIDQQAGLLRWRPPTDLQHFHAACDAGDHDRALALYRPPLIGDMEHGLGEPALELLAQQRRLAETRWRAAARARLQQLRDDPSALVPAAEQVLACEPLDEPAAQALAEACIALGQRLRALQVLQGQARRLQTELGAQPSPGVAALLRSLQAPTAGPLVPAPARSTSDEAVRHLIELAMDTVTDETKWPQLLRELTCATHGVGAMLTGSSFEQPAQAFCLVSGLDDNLTGRYLSQYQRNPWTFAVVGQPMGTTVNCTALVDRGGLVRTEFFQQISRPQGLQTMLARRVPMARPYFSGGVGVALADWRGPRVEGAHRLLDQVGPYLDKAASAAMRWRAADSREAGLEAALQHLPTAVFVVAADAQVLFANRQAERLLSQADGLRTDEGRLAASGSAGTRRLHLQVAQAARAATAPTVPADAIALARPSGAAPLRATVVAVGEMRDRLRLRLRPCALVYVSELPPS